MDVYAVELSMKLVRRETRATVISPTGIAVFTFIALENIKLLLETQYLFSSTLCPFKTLLDFLSHTNFVLKSLTRSNQHSTYRDHISCPG